MRIYVGKIDPAATIGACNQKRKNRDGADDWVMRYYVCTDSISQRIDGRLPAPAFDIAAWKETKTSLGEAIEG